MKIQFTSTRQFSLYLRLEVPSRRISEMFKMFLVISNDRSRLPTACEYAEYLKPVGTPSQGFYLVDCKNPDGSLDARQDHLNAVPCVRGQ